MRLVFIWTLVVGVPTAGGVATPSVPPMSATLAPGQQKPYSAPGPFELRLDPPAAATELDRVRIEAERLRAEADGPAMSDDPSRSTQAREGIGGVLATMRQPEEALPPDGRPLIHGPSRGTPLDCRFAV